MAKINWFFQETESANSQSRKPDKSQNNFRSWILYPFCKRIQCVPQRERTQQEAQTQKADREQISRNQLPNSPTMSHLENMEDDMTGADDGGGWCSIGCAVLVVIVIIILIVTIW
jgi:hypothetical protein